MAYGIAAATTACVSIVVEKSPLAPRAAVPLVPSTVMPMLSVVGGNAVPAAILPDTVIDAVPYVITWLADRLLNVGDALLTVNVVFVSVAPKAFASPE